MTIDDNDDTLNSDSLLLNNINYNILIILINILIYKQLTSAIYCLEGLCLREKNDNESSTPRVQKFATPDNDVLFLLFIIQRSTILIIDWLVQGVCGVVARTFTNNYTTFFLFDNFPVYTTALCFEFHQKIWFFFCQKIIIHLIFCLVIFSSTICLRMCDSVATL